MTDIKAKLQVNMSGNMLSQAQRYADQINKMTVSISRNLQRLKAQGGSIQIFGNPNAQSGQVVHLISAITSLTTAVSTLTPAIHQLNTGMQQNHNQLRLNTAELDRFNNRIDRTSSSVNRLQRSGSGFGMRMGALAVGSMTAGGLVRADVELEKAMLKVKSNLVSSAHDANDLNNRMKEVRATARELSEMTIFSDAQIVDAVGQLLKAGVNPKFVQGKDGAAASTVALAQLNDMNPTEAAEYVGKIGRAFNFKTKEQYYGLGDYLSKSDDASAMNVRDILYNVSQGSSNANRLHINVKDLIAMNSPFAHFFSRLMKLCQTIFICRHGNINTHNEN